MIISHSEWISFLKDQLEAIVNEYVHGIPPIISIYHPSLCYVFDHPSTAGMMPERDIIFTEKAILCFYTFFVAPYHKFICINKCILCTFMYFCDHAIATLQ